MIQLIIEKEYSATNMTVGLLYNELKLTAKLLDEGYTTKEIRKQSYEDNIYQARSENFNKTMTPIVLSRVSTLDDVLVKMLSNSGLELGRQIAIYTVMKSDRLFFEFMREIYYEKLINREYKIYPNDIEKFMNMKRDQSPKISKWKNTTTNRLKSSYINMLCEAGFIKRHKEYTEITHPIIDFRLKEHLNHINESIYLDIMSGEF